MELLQKLTLYDLLGYTLPGCVFICILDWQNICLYIKQGGNTFFYITVLVLTGYLTGIIISEIMSRVLKMLKDNKLIKQDKQNEKIFKEYGIDFSRLKEALLKAKFLEENVTVMDTEVYSKYEKQIYANIQTDANFGRIHNYASAELLYRNMVFVAFVGGLCGICIRNTGMFVLGICCVLFFFLRCEKFYKKKMGYSLCWFIGKYDK